MKAIMYHYVQPNALSLPYFRHLHIDAFKKQLDYFVDEGLSFLTKQQVKDYSWPTDSVLLTFDDGFKCHYKYVLPELQKRGLWGIFYIPVAPYLTDKLLDVHRIHLLLGKYGGKKIFGAINELLSEEMLSHSHVQEFREKTYELQSNDNYTNYVKRTLNYFISYEYRKEVLNELMRMYYPKETYLVKDFYMAKEEILEMRDVGMIIGSHSVNHLVMSKLSKDLQKREIEGSFQFLEDMLGVLDIKTFCYPYGGFHSFTEETEGILEDCNCSFSFNVEERDINQNDFLNRRQALPRYDCGYLPYGGVR